MVDRTEAVHAGAESSGTRGRILAALRAAEDPSSVDDIAGELGVHRNTVRFHLETLVAEGLVTEDRQSSGGRGRPRAVFRPTSHGARSGRRNYQLIAGILTHHLADSTPDASSAAHQAGLAWGRRLAGTTASRPGHSRVPAAVEMLDAMGFEPRPGPPGRPTHIQLFNCPFREMVDDHQELVCAMHAGLIEGMLEPGRFGEAPATDAEAARLQPFATTRACVVHLGSPTSDGAVAPQPPP